MAAAPGRGRSLAGIAGYAVATDSARWHPFLRRRRWPEAVLTREVPATDTAGKQKGSPTRLTLAAEETHFGLRF